MQLLGRKCGEKCHEKLKRRDAKRREPWEIFSIMPRQKKCCAPTQKTGISSLMVLNFDQISEKICCSLLLIKSSLKLLNALFGLCVFFTFFVAEIAFFIGIFWKTSLTFRGAELKRLFRQYFEPLSSWLIYLKFSIFET